METLTWNMLNPEQQTDIILSVWGFEYWELEFAQYEIDEFGEVYFASEIMH